VLPQAGVSETHQNGKGTESEGRRNRRQGT
jgi:hypothetical protein